MKRKIERKNYIGFYVTQAERDLIHEGAIAAGKTISSYLRDLAKQDKRERETVQIPSRKRQAEYA